MFTEQFGRYVCEGDTIKCTVDGFDCVATLYHDDCDDAPWERDDGHGPVSGWTARDKRAGERVLSQDRNHKRFYDFAEACKIALRDGWGSKPFDIPGETRRQKAARAAEADFKNLKAWCDDEWHYYGVAVRVSRAGIALTGKYDHALWGIEGNYPDSDNSYLCEVANELIDDALDSARKVIASLCATPAES